MSLHMVANPVRKQNAGDCLWRICRCHLHFLTLLEPKHYPLQCCCKSILSFSTTSKKTAKPKPLLNINIGQIMESGAQSTAPIGPTNSTWEDAYIALLAATNCTSPSAGNVTQFQCLKALPANELLQGQLAVRNQTEFAAG